MRAPDPSLPCHQGREPTLTLAFTSYASLLGSCSPKFVKQRTWAVPDPERVTDSQSGTWTHIRSETSVLSLRIHLG